MEQIWISIDRTIKDIRNNGYKNIKPYKTKFMFPNIPNIPDIQPSSKSPVTNLKQIFNVNKVIKDITLDLEAHVKPNTTLAYIDEYLYKASYEHGVYPSVLGHEQFPKSSCISLNNVVCHGIPYQIKLREGDIVTVDYCLYNGMHTDWAHTYIIGKVSGEHKKLVSTTEECLRKAVEICKPGAYYNTIGKLVTKVANENGFQVIEKYGGHRIGSDLHMRPYISNHPYRKKEIMNVGDVFTIEPLVAIGSGQTFIANDGFSILTKSKSYSAHFERCVLITESGHQVLNE